jgi:2-C-methyl-D-erythritol 4-phosphate cytidylyltransferase / 2-C-methyl-D-erythritol 2,4-cyclodiphosphate synthase
MNHAIILSAGKSSRMQGEKEKLLMEVGGKPIIYYSIMAIHDNPNIDSVTLVVSKKNKAEVGEIVKKHRFTKVQKLIIGGKTRMESLQKGVESLKAKLKKTDIIVVHNGANPLPSQAEIDELVIKTEEIGACISGRYVSSTIKEIDGGHIIKTHDRTKLFEAQTPQAAKYGLLEKALKNAEKKGLEATDEAVLLEAIGQKVGYVEADENNFKITSFGDIERLKHVLGETPEDFRIGIGQDSHLFDDKKKGLVLGGILIEEELKLKANSDGDVVLHAIFNAISQALGKMSIGFYADKQCEEGIKDSKKYLQTILEKMEKEKFKINSVGLMIECKTPKIDPLVAKMKKALAGAMSIPATRIGITATSGENATIFGEGLGIQCFAIVSLIKKKLEK